MLVASTLVACGGRLGADSDGGKPLDASSDETAAFADAGSSDASQTGLVVLSHDAQHPLSIAVDDTHVYWTNEVGSGSVARCGQNDCASTMSTIASKGAPQWIAVDAANVYWTDMTYGVWKCPVSAWGTPTMLAASSYPTFLTLDETNVYWMDESDITVRSCAIAGCAAATIVAKGDMSLVHGLVVDATNAYWSLDHVIQTCPLAGCAAPTALVTESQTYTFALAIDSHDLYWTTAAPGAVLERSLADVDAGATTLVSMPSANSQALVVDDTNVYWTDFGEGKVMKCAIAGCATPTVIADAQNGPAGIAVDASSVYWVNILGDTVMRFTPK